MKSDLIRIPTEKMSKDEWLSFRQNGIGGSEVAVVLGLSPYKSSVELFYEKLRPSTDKPENEAMHWGNALEDLIADRWRYWEGNVDQMLMNFAAGKQVRNCKRVNAYIINKKYPYLFSSLDREINKTETRGNGVLEIKTISGYASKMWENGIPPYHVIQLQTYLLVTEYEFGELAILKDGRYMDVVPFEVSETIHRQIVDRCKDFWELVRQAKQILIENGVSHYDALTNQKAIEELHRLEPMPDGSEAYEHFISNRYKAKPFVINGTDEILIHASNYAALNSEIKKIEADQRVSSNTIKAFMQEAEEIDFGQLGKVTWKENAKGNRVFNVKLKVARKEESYAEETAVHTTIHR